MASEAQIEKIVKKLADTRPGSFLNCVDETQAGIGAVLKLLDNAEGGELTSGRISELMCVSTARVAALLKKMEAKELVTRRRSSIDARITMVALTERGSDTARIMKANMYEQIGRIIDRVGEETLIEFADILVEIQRTLKPPKIEI